MSALDYIYYKKAFILNPINNKMQRKRKKPFKAHHRKKQRINQKLKSRHKPGRSIKKSSDLTKKITLTLQQFYFRGKALDNVKIAKIFLEQKRILKAKHHYAKALLFYFKMPHHEHEVNMKLKSLLKQIEINELQPHWEFHNSSREILNLKMNNKKHSKESLEAIKRFKKTLASHPDIAIPEIKDLIKENQKP